MATSDNGNEPEPSEKFYRFLEYELNFQRTRKQEVFTWASSLLVAIIGGVIALTAVHGTMLALPYKGVLTFAVAILCWSSWRWMELHWAAYLRARKKLSFYYDQIATNGKDSPWKHDYTSIAAVLSLSIVALISVWWPIPCYPAQ
jgi:hypothetical protein